MKDKRIYLNIIITVVISYILIKFIDNYDYFFSIISLLLSLLTPFVIAFILAYILNPIVNLLEKKLRLNRIISLFITYGFFMILLGVFIVFTVPSLIQSVSDIVNQLPTYAKQTQDFLFKVGESLKTIDPNTLEEIMNKVMSAMPQVSNLFRGYIGNIFSTTFSIGKFIIQFCLAFIICFYILLFILTSKYNLFP